MIGLVKVSHVKALDGARLWVLLSNGMEGARDCTGLLSESGWPNGFDIDAIQLSMEMKAQGTLGPEVTTPAS